MNPSFYLMFPPEFCQTPPPPSAPHDHLKESVEAVSTGPVHIGYKLQMLGLADLVLSIEETI